MKLLIVGGAGYIGSHTVKLAQDNGHEVVILDNFSTGHLWAIKDCEILNIDLLDKDKLKSKLKGRFFDGVIHFAAKSIVTESVKFPITYYANNVAGTINLLEVMDENNITNLVFSSSAAVYGHSTEDKICEDHTKIPISPYGKTKLMIENIIEDHTIANTDFSAISLRYFNAAGAHSSGEIGELHEPETHLIPNILNSVLSDSINLDIFGNDYSTKDGTCIRDYVHVMDLATAHLSAVQKQKQGYNAYNLGNGNGFSVLDIIKSCEKIINKEISYNILPRRPSDPAVLVAEYKKASLELGWNPTQSSIDSIISSAFNWHKNHNHC